jgi:hypothetical protein
MGSIALDKIGNIALGYSASSSSLNPSIRITGRLPGDPLGTMTQGDVTVKAGTGSQTDPIPPFNRDFFRWGDYSSMSVDPVDGCTFWYAQEYLATTGVFNWRTHLQSFTLPGCLSAVPTLTTAASPGVAPGGQVFDKATLAGGVNPTGAIAFRLYGPGDATCTGAPAFISAGPVSGNGTYVSGSLFPAVVGTYRWIAAYSGDVNNPSVSTACNDPNETVVVSAAPRPTLTTTASPDVALGGQVFDKATLAGGVAPIGAIAFRLYGPGDAVCAGAPAFITAVAVSGNGTYTSGPFTPTVVGTYRWIAAYSGDVNNPSVSTACNDANEDVVVSAVAPVTLTARASPDVKLGGQVSDTATLAGGVTPTGTITFRLFGPGSATCTGTAAFTSTRLVSGNGSYTSAPFTPTVVGTYRWIAAYSGDANNSPVSTVCNAPGQTVRVIGILPVTGLDIRSLATVAVGLIGLGCLFIIVSSGASRRVRRRA